MRNFLILGSGAAGTMVANKMSRLLDPSEWRITVIDRGDKHYYQPGFLFIPFGIYAPQDVVKPRHRFLPRNARFILSDIELIEPDQNRLRLTTGKQVLSYDYLVIATGAHIQPRETPGLGGDRWHKTIFDFYTFEGALALRDFLKTWKGGHMVVNLTEMPIKCPIAPLEMAFLSDWHFNRLGMRDKVQITFATPLSGAFTRPKASEMLGGMLEKKDIRVEADFNLMEIDQDRQIMRSYDDREIPFDLLVSVPTNMGSDVIGRSGMGDELNFVPVDKNTLQSTHWENVWAIGDASNVPTSKAGSVAHFMLETLTHNILRHMKGQALRPTFDGHANCFIESGYGKAVLIDFNYEVEPLPGLYPFPIVGPLPLLKDSPLNHWGKLGSRWLYWNILIRARPFPLSANLDLKGKRFSANEKSLDKSRLLSQTRKRRNA
jgi:sulfide:quinone oxidoreductase